MNYAPGSSVMPFESTSRVSRVTSIGHTIEETSNSNPTTILDKFFFVGDELSRCAPNNSILIFIMFFISFYQYYITSYFPSLSEPWDFTTFPDKILRYLTYPVDFGLSDPDIFETGIPSYVILILSALIAIYLIVIISYYQINKVFPRHTALLSRIIISFIIPIILSPSCYNIGISFNAIFSGNPKNKSLYIASTVLGILFYIFLTIFFYIDIMFRSSTPYLEDTPLSSWDNLPLFLCIFGSSITILFSKLIERLPLWTNYLLIVCTMTYNSYILFMMFFFPMIKHWMNVLISSIVSSCIIASLFQLIPIPAVYRLVIPFGLFIIIMPVFFAVFRRIRKRVVMKNIEEVNIANENVAIRYLRLTISDKCADFIGFKWIKPINQVSTTRILVQVAQIISFFPSESQNLKFYISLLSKKNDLSFHQRFLFFQIRRVHILRQSNTSKQLNDDLSQVAKATNQTIASFSQFLMRIIDERQELTIDRLNYLAKLNRASSSLCHEALGRYPNNSRLLFLFARYVIECQADFKGGVQLYQEGQSIERGKRATVDYAFRSMINLFPAYLLKRILDYKGKNIHNRRRSKNGSSMSVDSVSNEKGLVSDTDIESNEKIASNVLENPRLRFSLRKAVNNMNSTGITIISLSSILRFLMSIVTFIVIIVVASDFLNDRKINYENIATVGRLRRSLDLSLFRMAKLWSLNLQLSPKQEDVTASLGEGVSLQEYHNFSFGAKRSLFQDAIDSIHWIEELGKLLSQVEYQESMNIFDKSTTDFVQYHNISFCNRKNKTVVHSETSVRYFSLYLLNQVMHASSLDLVYDNPSQWIDDESICEVILNMQSVINVLNDQSSVLVSQEEELSEAVEKDIIIFFCITIPIVFAAYIIPFIVGYVKMNMEFRQIFDVLNLLPIKIYKEASQPIALFQPDEEQSQEAMTQSENKSCQKIVILIPAILTTIVITGSLIGVCFLILDSNSKFYNLVKWLEIGSGRTPLLIETVTNTILAGVYGYLGDTDYTTLVNHLQLVFNNSQLLLYQHKTLIWGSENSTSCNNFSERLDALHFTNSCVISMQSEDFQRNYRCMSLDQQVMTFNKFAKDVYLTLIYAQQNSNVSDSDYNLAFINILNGYEAINLHYLGISFLLPKLEEAQDILNEGINLKIDQLREISLIIALCTLFIEFILFIIETAIINGAKDEYNIVRILIARLPPLSVVQNQTLVELMTGQTDNQHKKQMSPILIHIRYCSNSIIIFDKQCKIQLINSATSKIFGFTKEQLYHANISTIIRKEDCTVIQDIINRNDERKEKKKKGGLININKNNNNNNNNNNENETKKEKETEKDEKFSFLLDENEQENININLTNKKSENVDLFNSPFELVVIGLKENGSQVILSAVLAYLPDPDDVYALIMRDETSIVLNDGEIKQSKQRELEIMGQILPPPIKQNGLLEENISFSVKFASVITMKILNFNESVPHITSLQAIRIMTDLYNHFDTQLACYPNLTKTNVISESYQAIGGLFNPSSIRRYSSRADDESQLFILDGGKEGEEEDDNEEYEYEGEEEAAEGSSRSGSTSGRGTPKKKKKTETAETSNDTPNQKPTIAPKGSILKNSTTTSNNSSTNNNNNNNNNTNNNNSNDNGGAGEDGSAKKPMISQKGSVRKNIGFISIAESKGSFNELENENENEGNDGNGDAAGGGDAQSPSPAQKSSSGRQIVTHSSVVRFSNANNANSSRPASPSRQPPPDASPDGGLLDTASSESGRSPKSGKVKTVRRRKSIYDIKAISASSLPPATIANFVIDSLFFAFNCISITDHLNAALGTNFVLGVGINTGGPLTAGTLGREHVQFDVVGGAVKASYIVCNAAEAGAVVLTEEALQLIKESPDVKANFTFERYKLLQMQHQKKVQTYLVRVNEVSRQASEVSPQGTGGQIDVMETLQATPSENQLPKDGLVSPR